MLFRITIIARVRFASIASGFIEKRSCLFPDITNNEWNSILWAEANSKVRKLRQQIFVETQKVLQCSDNEEKAKALIRLQIVQTSAVYSLERIYI